MQSQTDAQLQLAVSNADKQAEEGADILPLWAAAETQGPTSVAHEKGAPGLAASQYLIPWADGSSTGFHSMVWSNALEAQPLELPLQPFWQLTVIPVL